MIYPTAFTAGLMDIHPTAIIIKNEMERLTQVLGVNDHPAYEWGFWTMSWMVKNDYHWDDYDYDWKQLSNILK